MNDLKKVVVKVKKQGIPQWVHFCYAPADLCNEFFTVTGCKPSELNKYLSAWARGDYSLKSSMETYDDIITLRHYINMNFKRDYPELFILTDRENPQVTGLTRLWLSQHMRIEIAARKRGD